MAITGSVEVRGLEQVKAALKQYGAKAEDALMQGIRLEAEEVKTEASREAPFDTGALAASGFVKDEGKNSVVVGFGGPSVKYALRQHEEHKSKGKYLERPFLRATNKLGTRLAEHIKRTLG